MRITIKDIAKKAGVSPAAVSKALNGQPDIGESTKERILSISRELGYTPNRIARSLVTKGNKTVGVLIPDISTPIYPSIYKGINETAVKYGYTLLLGDTKRSLKSERDYILTMMENRVSGLLVSPVSNSIDHLEEVVKGQVPIIYFGGKVNDSMENYVGINNYRGSILAMNHLIELGHRDIVMLCDDLVTKTRQDRVSGYRDVMEREHLEPRVLVNRDGLKGRECGYATTKMLLESEDTLPTSIFALNDLMAIGVMEALSEKGLHVPQDISVIGYDDISFASLPMIGLTTVWQPKFKVGDMAMELLYNKLGKNSQEGSNNIILEPELRIRTSSRKL